MIIFTDSQELPVPEYPEYLLPPTKQKEDEEERKNSKSDIADILILGSALDQVDHHDNSAARGALRIHVIRKSRPRKKRQKKGVLPILQGHGFQGCKISQGAAMQVTPKVSQYVKSARNSV